MMNKMLEKACQERNAEVVAFLFKNMCTRVSPDYQEAVNLCNELGYNDIVKVLNCLKDRRDNPNLELEELQNGKDTLAKLVKESIDNRNNHIKNLQRQAKIDENERLMKERSKEAARQKDLSELSKVLGIPIITTSQIPHMSKQREELKQKQFDQCSIVGFGCFGDGCKSAERLKGELPSVKRPRCSTTLSKSQGIEILNMLKEEFKNEAIDKDIPKTPIQNIPRLPKNFIFEPMSIEDFMVAMKDVPMFPHLGPYPKAAPVMKEPPKYNGIPGMIKKLEERDNKKNEIPKVITSDPLRGCGFEGNFDQMIMYANMRKSFIGPAITRGKSNDNGVTLKELIDSIKPLSNSMFPNVLEFLGRKSSRYMEPDELTQLILSNKMNPTFTKEKVEEIIKNNDKLKQEKWLDILIKNIGNLITGQNMLDINKMKFCDNCKGSIFENAVKYLTNNIEEKIKSLPYNMASRYMTHDVFNSIENEKHQLMKILKIINVINQEFLKVK